MYLSPELGHEQNGKYAPSIPPSYFFIHKTKAAEPEIKMSKSIKAKS